MLHQKVVRVKITDIDRYGRHVGVIYRYRKNVNEELVKRGAAWVYEDYIRDRKQLAHMRALQTQARARKKASGKVAARCGQVSIANRTVNKMLRRIFKVRR